MLPYKKELINTYKTISFDIFDTLLLRPYTNPEDLFTHLEKLERNCGFAKRRVYAEDLARRFKPRGQDINLDEIYDNLSDADKTMKQKELDLEARVLQINPEIFELFNYAKEQKKEIFIISDMYLSKEFLETVLAARGVSGYKRLYVSSRTRKLKATSELYRHILNKEKISPSQMLHIGDNPYSDYKQAASAGINAFLYISPIQKYLNNHKKQAKLLKNKKYSFNASVVLALAALKQLEQNNKSPYFETLGYEIAGPAAYGFAKFIEKTAQKRKIKDILFIARDGYGIYKIFETFNKKIRAQYIYAPRLFSIACLLDNTYGKDTSASVLYDYFKPVLPEDVKYPKSAKQAEEFLQKYKEIIHSFSKQKLEQYGIYIKKNLNTRRTIVADSLTFSFAAQRLIKKIISGEVLGIYWSATKNKKYNYDTFLPASTRIKKDSVHTKCWDFMEFIFCEPAPPVLDITADGKPIYKTEINSFEKENISAQKNIIKGEISFAKDIKNIFGGFDIFLEGNFLVEWINIFLNNPSKEDIESLRCVYHASDPEHKKYYPLFVYRPKPNKILSDFIRYLKFSRLVLWKTPLQYLISIVLWPIIIFRKIWQKNKYA
ncbi:MAG: HAD hydrolase-like protein [Elusimicrobiota bacterium]|jgi:predicted HAD superfamily hydrolase|nr:HAD hydrolase-like protein [Elusimicrobiota bacterium]